MLPLEHSAILLTIKLTFVINAFVLSNFERPFYIGFSVPYFLKILATDSVAEQADLSLSGSQALMAGFLMAWLTY